MEIKVLRESGYEEAMLGLSLSFGKPVEDMPRVAEKLYDRDDSESKFLRQIVVWLDIVGPRYWWQQFDTYSVGTPKQSSSTMHTIMKRELDQSDFEQGVPNDLLFIVNNFIQLGDFNIVKRILPESFLQRRIVCTNYQVLRRIIRQRKNHKLPEWKEVITGILNQIEHKEFFADFV